jgi:hypothetical protein
MVESPAQFGRLRTLIHPGPVSGGHVTWIEDRGARRNGKFLKIGEGLPATLVAIAAIGRSKLPPIRLNECGRCGPPGIGRRDLSTDIEN